MKRRTIALGAILAAASCAAIAQPATTEDPRFTRRGWEIGAQAANYHYEEPNVVPLGGGEFGPVKITGNRGGVVGAYTYADQRHLFSRLEGRISYGRLKYEGSGTQNNVPDWITELRLLAGKDLPFGDRSAFSPYFGFGYRFLFDDTRGYSSTGASGYRRYSNYWYAPLGVTLRFRMAGQVVIAPNVEYDYFFHGTQISKLSDVGDPTVGDITNEQSQGYGYRGNLMFESNHWAFGPWLNYWKIKDSDVACSGAVCGLEPKNWTREWGVELRYRF